MIFVSTEKLGYSNASFLSLYLKNNHGGDDGDVVFEFCV